MKYYLAIDIGASSGRHIIGYKDENNELILDEVYRFKNGPQTEDNHLIWNIDYLFDEVKKGIHQALLKYPNIESLSIDTWGVDYVLMDENYNEIYPCYCYRDHRTKDVINLVHELIDFKTLYKKTGSQFQEFNTIYQLFSDKMCNRLSKAKSFLYIPEYLIFKLTGVEIHEYTNASTSGMLDCKTNSYSKEIISSLGFDEKLFSKLSKPKQIVGELKDEIINEVKGNIKVVLCPTHDTASAVEGIPIDEDGVYISSGTWSLLGIKTDSVINSKEALEANYSNEYGPDYIRFQKNIMGLWIIQNISKQSNINFGEMITLAKTSTFEHTYDVNDNVFLASNNMSYEIINWFKRNKMPYPNTLADIINATFHSLALSYKNAISELEKITNRSFKSIYIVGGGAKNQYLNELTEKYTKKNVIALPIEATAIGNLLTQMEV